MYTTEKNAHKLDYQQNTKKNQFKMWDKDPNKNGE